MRKIIGAGTEFEMHGLGDWLKDGVLISDGAWGTQLQARGLPVGALPDTWNLTHPEQVEDVARTYVEAGSQVILTNSFRAHAIAMHASSAADLDAINRAAVEISKKAAGTQALVFASIGPAGKMLVSGEVSAEELTWAFTAQAQSLARAGADALLIETMSDPEEARLAVAAAKATGLPVIASPIPEVARYKGLVALARTAEEYEREIDAILKTGDTGPSAARSERMASESWDAKVMEIEALLRKTNNFSSGG